jgi:TPR repeat protein
MGKKSSAKAPSHNQPPPVAPPEQAKGPSPFVLGAVIVAVAGIITLAFWRPNSAGQTIAASSSSPATAAPTSTDQQATATAPAADAKAIARAEAAAKLGPHKQATLPPVPFQVGYAPPRSREVVAAAYQFAAEHPEVLSYVPCFCGCQRAGHQGNADCFVKSRADNGDVIEWDDHGVDCAVCLDVATRSRQMYASGASVRDIRTAIDKEFGGLYPTAEKMATPSPPAKR